MPLQTDFFPNKLSEQLSEIPDEYALDKRDNSQEERSLRKDRDALTQAMFSSATARPSQR
jgi:hypothetical protein